MVASNPTESQAKQDVQHLKGAKEADRPAALSHFSDQANSMSSKDLKTEQSYWNNVSKAVGKGHLPGLDITKGQDGNVERVSDGKGHDIYNRAEEVKKTVDNFTGGLKKGQGPFQAFKDAGLTDQEASENAKAVVKGMGRNTFKEGEKLGVHSDKSVTSTTTGHDGKTTEERYNQDKTRETKVTDKDGNYNTTFKTEQGAITKTLEHKKENGTTTDTTKDPKGITTEKSQLDEGGTLRTTKNYPGTEKPKETTVKDRGGTTTTEFRQDGTTAERTKSDVTGTTNIKFQDNGTTPTEKTTTKDGITTKRSYAANGIDTTELSEKGTDGLTTTTKFDATTKKPTSQHKETADGYVDTKYKDGQPDVTTQHTNKPNGAWSEHVNYLDKDPTKRYDSVREATAPDEHGKFRYTQNDTQYKVHTNYDIQFEKGGQNGTGTKTIIGKDGRPHVTQQTVMNGVFLTQSH